MPGAVVIVQEPVKELLWRQVYAVGQEQVAVAFVKQLLGVDQHAIIVPQHALDGFHGLLSFKNLLEKMS